VAITDIWMWSPFVMLLSLAGLSAVPKHLYEARPSIAPAPGTPSPASLAAGGPLLLIALILPHDGGVQDVRYRLHDDHPATAELIAIRLYKQAFQQWDTGKSCALAYIVLIMVLAITNIYVKYLNRVRNAEMATVRSARRPS